MRTMYDPTMTAPGDGETPYNETATSLEESLQRSPSSPQKRFVGSVSTHGEPPQVRLFARQADRGGAGHGIKAAAVALMPATRHDIAGALRIHCVGE